MKYVTIILFIISAAHGLACDCSPEKKLIEAQMDEFANSNLIMIGNVIKISDDQRFLTVVAKEIFKGDLGVNDTIVFENNYYCEPYVDIGGDWILYGKLTDKACRINECGLSRSLIIPERNRYFRYLPAPPSPLGDAKDDTTLKEEKRVGEEKARQFALDKLEKEIAELRYKKK